MRKHSFLLLLLIGLHVWTSAYAGDKPLTKNAAGSHNGELWTATANWVWRNVKVPPKQKKPQAWATSDEFKYWTEQNEQGENDRSGLVSLRKKVLDRLKNKGRNAGSTTSAELATAILVEIPNISLYSKMPTDSLKHTFDQFLNPTKPTGTKADQQIDQKQQNTRNQFSPVDSANGKGDAHTSKEMTTNGASESQNSGGNPPQESASAEKWGLGGVLLGLLLGFGLAKLIGRGDQSALTERNAQLKAKNEELRDKLKREEQKAWQSPVSIPARSEQEVSSRAAVAEQLQQPDPPAAIAPPVPAPAVVPSLSHHYAPAPEGGYIEERNVKAEARPHLPIMLILDARHSDQAAFKLNPHVNQALLIGDGLEQLDAYFNFTRKVGATSVTDAGAGKLKRKGEGWEVESKAKLNVR